MLLDCHDLEVLHVVLAAHDGALPVCVALARTELQSRPSKSRHKWCLRPKIDLLGVQQFFEPRGGAISHLLHGPPACIKEPDTLRLVPQERVAEFRYTEWDEGLRHEPAPELE